MNNTVFVVVEPFALNNIVGGIVAYAEHESPHNTIGVVLDNIVNIVFDPIFIFDWGFGLGVMGAAVATVLGQFCSMVFTIIMFIVTKPEVKVSFKFVRMKGKTLASIYKIGLPTIILNAVSSFTIMIILAYQLLFSDNTVDT